MIKNMIYPKTERIKCSGKIELTEKLDGSNLVIFKKNDKLYIAQRNYIYTIDEALNNSLYKGLNSWLKEHYEVLQKELYEGSAICGEWLGMGQIGYSQDKFDKRFYMFAKARVEEERNVETISESCIRIPCSANFKLDKLVYDHDTFFYVFESKVIPDFIGIVPVVDRITYFPQKEDLDRIYDEYCQKENRKVEGFVINICNNIQKYVRMKEGKLVEYSDTDHKGML